MKITPGPWVIEETDRTENGLDLLIRGSKDEHIGWLYWQHSNEGKLISAAPEMYEAIYEVLNQKHELDNYVMELCRNALKNAGG